MGNLKKNKRFDLLNLRALEMIFKNLIHDTKCDEVKISYDDSRSLDMEVVPIKILESIDKKEIKGIYGFYVTDILGEYFFDHFIKNKKSKALKNKKIESIDVSKYFIRFNLKEE